ncbi:MAG: GntP family permease [Bacteriovoracaceae bacterium]|nr:GntP family permease [Bacteriovoracaceae bacterium]
MIGLSGLVISLIALMYFAYRGVNVLVLAPICAIAAVLFQPEIYEAGNHGISLAHYTQIFMGSLGKYIVNYFPIFLLGAIFGKLMNDTRSAEVIGETISKKLGSKHAILATVLACGILTYGGVSLFVVAFCVYPISLALFAEAGIPRKFIPGSIALGSFTFTMTALPGTPSIQNAIPMPYFGTTAFAAPGLGIIASVIMLGLGLVWMNYHSAKERVAVTETNSASSTENRPAFWLAMTPLLLVILLNFTFSQILIPQWEAGYLSLPKFGGISLKNTQGLWAIILSLTLSVFFILIFMRKYNKDMIESVNKGTMGSLLPIFNTSSEVGYGAVIASLAAFALLKDSVVGIFPSNPLISEAIAINALAGITGSASGGMSIGLEVLGAKYLQLAQELNISPDLLHRVASLSSGGFDTLPHNGAVISLLTICGLTHRDSYFDIFMTAVAIPVVATITVITLGSVFGSF